MQHLYCAVERPGSWDDAFEAARIHLDEDQRFAPVVPAPDASRAFGALYSPEWSGVAAIAADSKVTKIREFGDPSVDQITGAGFDGRWLVWSESHSPVDLNNWDIRAWDSSTDAVFDLGSAPESEQSVFVLPIVSKGMAAWIQPSETSGFDAHLFSLSERSDTIISRDDAIPPILFYGTDLIWGVQEDPGSGEGQLQMMNTETGERMPPPEPLASLTHFGSVAASGDIVAWTEDLHSLSVWQTGDESPIRVVPPGTLPGVDFIAIAGSLVTWGGTDRQWAADVRSHSLTGITEEFGYRVTNGEALLVAEPTGDIKDAGDALVPPLKVSLVDVADLEELADCN